MRVLGVAPQLRTTDLEASITFWTQVMNQALAFRVGDFYAGIQAGAQVIHLKRVDAPDPSIAFVAQGDHLHLWLETDDVDAAAAALLARGAALRSPPHDTDWGTRELILVDDQGHTIHLAQPVKPAT
ncbi:MAG: VOC family protein [Pseudomonadota bacterium]